MKEHEVEQKLRRALEHAAPNQIEAVLARCGRQTGEPIVFPKRPIRRLGRRWVPWAAAACLVLVVAGGAAGLRYRQNRTVASVVSLDVNPSVELQINQSERVLSALPRSDDAYEILDGMELEGTDLDVAVNAILGSLLKHGYVDELANSVLVSVEDDDLVRGTALEEKLTGEISQALEAASVNGAILSQTFAGDPELQAKAEEYGISQGKAALIQTLVEGSSHLTFEALVGLSINELNLLANSTAVQDVGGETASPAETDDTLSSTGNASQSAYIGVEAAKAAALAHAGVTSGDAVFLEADYDYEDGRMVYEIEFMAGDVQYEYDVDATTGGVLKYEQEQKRGSAAAAGSGAASDIGEAAAKSAALQDAGVAESQIAGLQVKRDYDDGCLIYEVDFQTDSAEYEYEIDGATGGIRQSQRKDRLPSGQAIGRDRARDAALAHAGVTLDQISELEVEEELDEAVPSYKVEFRSGRTEYEYEIDAVTGAVLNYEWDN